MKRITIAVIAAAAFAFAGTASAALVPGVFDPGNTGCPVAQAENGGWLRLAKNCATSTNAAAGADLTGLSGLSFKSASFTLKSASQCQGGSPRFNIVTTAATFFLGCNNVAPVPNADGTARYTFTAATLAASGQQVPMPIGTITSFGVLIDVQGVADVKSVRVNDIAQTIKEGKRTGDGRGEKHGHHAHHGLRDHGSDHK